MTYWNTIPQSVDLTCMWQPGGQGTFIWMFSNFLSSSVSSNWMIIVTTLFFIIFVRTTSTQSNHNCKPIEANPIKQKAGIIGQPFFLVFEFNHNNFSRQRTPKPYSILTSRKCQKQIINSRKPLSIHGRATNSRKCQKQIL